MSKNLILSHWNDTKEVFVPEDVAENLCNYQIMGVRFLYDCFQKKLTGAILNQVDGMNVQIQVASFFNALNSEIAADYPLLVVCSQESIATWHYHLVQHGQFNVVLLTFNNYRDILDEDNNDCVFVATFDDLKLLTAIKHFHFFSVVVDQLDQVVSKNAIKRLKGQFNVGITERNFLKNPDQKLFWNLLNWSNPGGNGKFADFCIEDDYRLKNMQYPYPSWWLRLTWKFCESFKPKSLEETKEYRRALQRWSRQNYLQGQLETKSTKRRKRKLKSPDHSTSKDLLTSVSKSSYDVFNASQLVPKTERDEGHASDSEETIIYNLNEDEATKMEVESEPVETEIKEDFLSMLYGDTAAISTLDDKKMSTLISKSYAENKSNIDNSDVLSFLFD